MGTDRLKLWQPLHLLQKVLINVKTKMRSLSNIYIKPSMLQNKYKYLKIPHKNASRTAMI